MTCLVNGGGKIISKKEIEEIIRKVFKFLKNRKGDLSVNLVSEKNIKELNRQYRGKDKVTDVLSFPMMERGGWNEERSLDLGDIFICEAQVKRQATEYGVSEKEEFKRMLVHGVLHLLGFDHQTVKDATKMFKLQEKIIILL